MNRFEIRDILNAYKEHFRVLPTGAMNDLHGIIEAIDADKDTEKLLTYSEWEQVKLSEQKIKTIKETAAGKKESPAASLTVGKVAKKKAKKKKSK